jgi:membrane-anchored protein YejM (alkaline phosphatase superfamily)
MIRITRLFTVFLLTSAATATLAAGTAARVVVVVWDGMRPDFVGAQTTPTLWNLAQQGVTFRHHMPLIPA